MGPDVVFHWFGRQTMSGTNVSSGEEANTNPLIQEDVIAWLSDSSDYKKYFNLRNYFIIQKSAWLLRSY